MKTLACCLLFVTLSSCRKDVSTAMPNNPNTSKVGISVNNRIISNAELLKKYDDGGMLINIQPNLWLADPGKFKHIKDKLSTVVYVQCISFTIDNVDYYSIWPEIHYEKDSTYKFLIYPYPSQEDYDHMSLAIIISAWHNDKVVLNRKDQLLQIELRDINARP